MATMYAWSRIVLDRDPTSMKDTKVVQPGESVTAKGLGLSDEQFDVLVNEGVVRSLKYPETHLDESPVEAYRRAAREAAGAAMVQVEEARNEAQANNPDVGATDATT